jgi:hypothetical protein
MRVVHGPEESKDDDDGNKLMLKLKCNGRVETYISQK